MAVVGAVNHSVVIFSAPAWCIPCRRLAPHAKVVAEQMPEITFVEVDIDKSVELREKYEVMTVPFVISMHNGELAEVKGRTALQIIQELKNL